MSEQIDAFSRYDRLHSNLPVHFQRLSENIRQSQLYGDTDELKAERCRIANELNKLVVISTRGMSIEELWGQIEPTEDHEPTEHLLHINDPLSLTELGAEGPVYLFLENIKRIRSHPNWEEILRLSTVAMKRATEHSDQAGTATSLLYLADAQAWTGRLKEGIATAERARQLLRLQRDYHNTVVAHLLLARFKAGQSLDNAKSDYLEALGLCHKLGVEARETARNKEALLYEHIVDEIEQALQYVDAVIEQSARRVPLHPTAAPGFSGDHDMARSKHLNSMMIDYVTIGEFMIEGHKYHLYPLDRMQTNRLAVKPGAVHFALRVPEDGWSDPASRKGDYVLVRQEQATQEGPGVLWTGEEWVAGRFERDATSGDIRFGQKPRVIGSLVSDQSVALPVIAVLKPTPSSDPLLVLNREYRFFVDVLLSDSSDFAEELGRLSVIGELGQQPATNLTRPVRLPYRDMTGIDVTVRAEDMEVSPQWRENVKPSRGQESNLLEFTLVPREVGHKRIEVEFYCQRHWLDKIEFGAEVVSPDE